MGDILIPLPELSNRLAELNPNDTIVIYCQFGGRSLQAIHRLKKTRFQQVQYLKGGLATEKLSDFVCGPFSEE
jgi:rhodanese-related sulfurtransferase